MSLEHVSLDVPATCKLPHHGVQFSNGAKLIVVQDEGTQRSTAVMTIRVGSLHDPENLPGLAHLCEHMLFMGTEKYPEEAEYDKFVTQHGGFTNASTADMNTTYFFAVVTEFFLPALDRFLNFFVAPKFDPSSLEREIKNVDSEDAKNRDTDAWRQIEVFRTLVDPQHPASRMGNGNYRTLCEVPRAQGVDVREALVKFYAQYYTAGASCLTIYSSLSLDEVVAAVSPLMTQLRPGNAASNSYGVPPVSPSSLPCWTNVQTIGARQAVELTFLLPFSHKTFMTMPGEYASYVIGHEVKGSIVAALKEEEFAEELLAGCSFRGIDDDYDRLAVKVMLTNRGVQKLDEVISIIFQGIEVLRRAGVDDAIYDEVVNSRKLAFNFADAGSPVGHALLLSNNGACFGIKHAWSANVFIQKEDKEAAAQVIKYLVPSNCSMVLLLRSFDDPPTALPMCAAPLDKETENYQAKYSRVRIDHSLERQWANVSNVHPSLSMPGLNPFITKDFTVFPPEPGLVPHVLEFPHGKVYWRRDSGAHQHSPRTAFAMELQSTSAQATLSQGFYLRVLLSTLSDTMSELMYSGELGSMMPSLGMGSLGFELQVEGPTEKLFDFSVALLKRVITAHIISESLYEIHRHRAKRYFKTRRTEQPFRLGIELSNCALSRHFYNFLELDAVDPSYEGFREFLQNWLREVRYDAFWFGNIPPANSSADSFVPRRLGVALEQLFANCNCRVAEEEKLPRVRDVLQLPEPPVRGSNCSWAMFFEPFNQENENSSVEFFFQLGIMNPVTRSLTDVLVSSLSSEFFDVIRTKETLGYTVMCSNRLKCETCNISFIVQSSKYGPKFIISRVHAFIQQVSQYLSVSMTDETFDSIRRSQISVREDKPKTISEEASYYWCRRYHPYGFRHCDAEIEFLKEMKKWQLLEFADRVFNSLDGRKMICCVFGCNSLTDMENMKEAASTSVALEGMPLLVELKDLEQFRQTAPAFVPQLRGSENPAA